MNNQKPLFDTLCTKRLQKTLDICAERGTQYGDTWRNNRWLIMKSVATKLGIPLSDYQAIRLGCAVLCDIKYARFEGPFKVDNCDDGINYLAVLAGLMDGEAEEDNNQSPQGFGPQSAS